MTIVDTHWFGTIGIVKIHNGFETKWYIGQGFGIDERIDAEHIAKHGQPFYPQAMSFFFDPVHFLPELDDEEYYLEYVLRFESDPDEAKRIAKLPFHLWP